MPRTYTQEINYLPIFYLNFETSLRGAKYAAKNEKPLQNDQQMFFTPILMKSLPNLFHHAQKFMSDFDFHLENEAYKRNFRKITM